MISPTFDPLTTEVIALVRAHKRPPTLSALAMALNIGKPRLMRALDNLKELGYKVAIDLDQHLSLLSAPDRMIDIEIWAGLKTRSFGRHLHCYHRIGSTNAAAIDLAEHGAPEGTVVVAEEQTKGRGRLGRNWHSPPGMGIWSSVILRPSVAPAQTAGVSLIAAVAFAETVETELGLDVRLKWPNDGLIDGRKVCGILVELSAEVDRVNYAVCGVGINVAHGIKDFPPALRKTAGSLALAKGSPVDRLAFFRSFLYRFEATYRRFRHEGLTPLLPAYRQRSLLLGNKVTIRAGRQKLTGVAVAVDDSGGLIVRCGKKNIVVHSGEATLR
jgi:BirA family biotin operon repressor/biotin-[acetyl-CoA-carboxylase] ligase